MSDTPLSPSLAGPPREEQLRALVEKWRVEAKADARYGVKHATGGPVKEYIGPVNSALAKADCADELASLLAAVPSSAEGKENVGVAQDKSTRSVNEGMSIRGGEGQGTEPEPCSRAAAADATRPPTPLPSADVIARIVQGGKLRTTANALKERWSVKDKESGEQLSQLLDALASLGAPPNEAERDLADTLRTRNYFASGAPQQNADGWRPIATAPKDGTVIIAWSTDGGQPEFVWWHRGEDEQCWVHRDDGTKVDEYWLKWWAPILSDPSSAQGITPPQEEAAKAQRTAEGWRPIATAPKDGLIDVWVRGLGRVADAEWNDLRQEWKSSLGYFYHPNDVSHWMSKPSAPGITPPQEEK